MAKKRIYESMVGVYMPQPFVEFVTLFSCLQKSNKSQQMRKALLSWQKECEKTMPTSTIIKMMAKQKLAEYLLAGVLQEDKEKFLSDWFKELVKKGVSEKIATKIVLELKNEN